MQTHFELNNVFVQLTIRRDAHANEPRLLIANGEWGNQLWCYVSPHMYAHMIASMYMCLRNAMQLLCPLWPSAYKPPYHIQFMNYTMFNMYTLASFPGHSHL